MLGIDEAVPRDDVPVDSVTPDGTASDAAPGTFRLEVTALIDGRSHLVIQDERVHWQHFTFAAPGRSQLQDVATVIEEVEWFPSWPDFPTAENRDCDCVSSTTTLKTAVPHGAATVTAIASRRAPVIAQQPDPTNDFTLVVELSDEGFSGAAMQTIAIDVTP